MNRREFIASAGAFASVLGAGSEAWPLNAEAQGSPRVRLVDVTKAAGIDFTHRNGAYGGKLLPETMGAGCAFMDYDGDGQITSPYSDGDDSKVSASVIVYCAGHDKKLDTGSAAKSDDLKSWE